MQTENETEITQRTMITSLMALDSTAA